MKNFKETSPAPEDRIEDDQLPEVRNRFGLKALLCVFVLFLLFLLSQHAHWTIVLTAFLSFALIGILFRRVWRLAKEVRYISRINNQNHKGKI
jgi:hypothetical protein